MKSYVESFVTDTGTAPFIDVLDGYYDAEISYQYYPQEPSTRDYPGYPAGIEFGDISLIGADANDNNQLDMWSKDHRDEFEDWVSKMCWARHEELFTSFIDAWGMEQ